MSRRSINDALFPHGVPKSEKDLKLTFELYKMMVKSSEELVARRQGVNTFYVSINGALVAAIGLVVGSTIEDIFKSTAILLLCATGIALAMSWRSRIISFGQLNAGKFAVISRLERLLPVAIYDAEWIALGEGKDPAKYKTFTSREVWPPWTFLAVYVLVTIGVAVHIMWLAFLAIYATQQST